MRHNALGSALAIFAIIVLAGCSGSAASSAPASSAPAASVAASLAPSVVPSVAPSEAPSEAASVAPSELVPSFSFPSTDKELEALLPDKLCGVKMTKFSMGPEIFGDAADPEFVAVLQALGKSVDDVSFAVAGDQAGKTKCSAGIFRVKGADPAQFKEEFLKAAAAQGTTYTEKSIGGKDVIVDPTSEDSFKYAYFKGDALIFIGAATDADAESILAVLP